MIVQYKSKSKKEKALDKIKNKTDKEELSLEIKGEVDDDLNMVLIKSENKSTKELIEEFEDDDDVEFVEPNFKRELTFAPNDTYFPLQWPHINTGQTVDGAAGTSDADIDSTDAWDIESNSATDTIVAVIDDGVEHNHADLINNMWDGTSCVDDLGAVIVGGCPNHGWDYESLDNDPYGEEHGTFIASIIAGENNNGVGVTGLSRYNNIKIMALKFDFTVFTELKSLNFAKNNGAKVINASFTGTDFSQAEINFIESFDGIFVAAAGNTSNNNDAAPAYPCSYNSANIICVGSSDQNDNMSSFSNYGATTVDIVAPGENIIGRYLGTYYVGDGTSFAAPLVTGTAALLFSANPSLSFGAIKNNIISSGDSFVELGEKTVFGKRLNINNAYQLSIAEEEEPAPIPEPTPEPIVEDNSAYEETKATDFELYKKYLSYLKHKKYKDYKKYKKAKEKYAFKNSAEKIYAKADYDLYRKTSNPKYYENYKKYKDYKNKYASLKKYAKYGKYSKYNKSIYGNYGSSEYKAGYERYLAY